MKEIRVIGICAAMLVVALFATSLFADYCPECKGKARTCDVGVCSDCGGNTTSGANKFCPACSKRLGVCENCGTKLGASPPVAADTDAKIADLIAKLGADEYETREAAQAELQKIGKPAMPFLKKTAAESQAPEVSARCKAILLTFETDWISMLVKALKKDEFLLKQIGQIRQVQDAFDENAFRQAGMCTPFEIEGLDDMLTVPVRFYRINDRIFRTDNLFIDPPPIYLIGVAENGRAFVVTPKHMHCDGFFDLQRYAKPVKNKDEALKFGVAVARLNAFCVRCDRWRTVDIDPAKCTVEGTAGEGFTVTIPPESLKDGIEDEGAFVKFDKDGQLAECKGTGKTHAPK